jgi:hypothetical protein
MRPLSLAPILVQLPELIDERTSWGSCRQPDPSARLAKCLEGYTAMSSPPKLPFGGSGSTLSVSMSSYLSLSQDHDNKYGSRRALSPSLSLAS